MKTKITVYLEGASNEPKEYIADYSMEVAQQAWETYDKLLVQGKGFSVYIYRAGCSIIEFSEVEQI